jgi:hypothetical protein
MKNIKLIAIFALLTGQSVAFSHVVLDQATAQAGSAYKAVLRINHGCEGLPTTGVTVLLPPGVRGSKPQPKPGWTLAVRRAPLATPYTSHGRSVSEEVSEISWTAQSAEAALPDAHFDEFVVRTSLPDTSGPLWFKVLQTCQDGPRQGRNAWDQVPADGLSTRGLSSPAALLQVEPAEAKPHVHH